MQLFMLTADLHIHSKYARACSPQLSIQTLAQTAKLVGLNILGTGDCLHPAYLAELKSELVQSYPGLFSLPNDTTQFILQTEIASIYKQADKLRRVHNLIYFPSFESIDSFILELEKRKCNLKSDGRPIVGIHCPDLVEICKTIDKDIQVIPAHAWTPHFGVFGALSGFDTLEECYGEFATEIFAIETGISSDPKMNWMVESLDNIALISNSDAHSLSRLGREVNVFDLPEKDISYERLFAAIRGGVKSGFAYTLEFFPEEGRYHLDGHADCKFTCEPERTKLLDGRCPVCGRKIVPGVMGRVAELATRPYGYVPAGAVPYKNLIPLDEVIADTMGYGRTSKKAKVIYEELLKHEGEIAVGTGLTGELGILQTCNLDLVARYSNEEVAKNLVLVREGKIDIEPGYDGLYGKIKIKHAQGNYQSSMQAPLF